MGLSDIVKKITDTPRKLKEGAEEVGEKIEKEYRERREKPAAKEALAYQKERELENESKFKSGKISEKLYKQRSERYAAEAKTISVPVEKRVVSGAKSVAGTFLTGAKDVSKRFTADYASNTQTRIRTGKGSSRRVSPNKKSSSGRITGNSIDFGRGSALDFSKPGYGSGSLDFSQPLFGSSKKPRK